MNEAPFIKKFVRSRHLFISLLECCIFIGSLTETFLYLQFTNILNATVINEFLHVVHLYFRQIARFLFVEFESKITPKQKLVKFTRQFSITVLYTLIQHAISINQRARYIENL